MKDLMAFALNCNCIARRADRVVSGGEGDEVRGKSGTTSVTKSQLKG